MCVLPSWSRREGWPDDIGTANPENSVEHGRRCFRWRPRLSRSEALLNCDRNRDPDLRSRYPGSTYLNRRQSRCRTGYSEVHTVGVHKVRPPNCINHICWLPIHGYLNRRVHRLEWIWGKGFAEINISASWPEACGHRDQRFPCECWSGGSNEREVASMKNGGPACADDHLRPRLPIRVKQDRFTMLTPIEYFDIEYFDT